MKYRFKKMISGAGRLPDSKKRPVGRKGFSLTEAVVALVILALFSSSVLVVIDRCMAKAANSQLRMQAFETARENMEALLALNAVSEQVEYGSSDKYPEIQWQRTVEAFYEPITKRMWVKGVCAAEYTDIEGREERIELTHWLTDVTKEQLLQIIEQRQEQKERSAQTDEPDKEPEQDKETPEPEEEQEPPSEVDCDTLPFCERVRCYMKTGRPLTFDELVKYINECMKL